MNLAQVFTDTHPGSPPRVAFTGAGGKTSALFQAAIQLAADQYPTVLVTTTTHLAVEEIKYADRFYQFESEQSILSRLSPMPTGVVLVCGPGEGNRIGSLDANQLRALFKLSEINKIPLLIEADGSKRRPLKAPAKHEPVVPEFVSTVVVVAGLSAMGKDLGDDRVHRVEEFASISRINIGDPITPDGLARVLTHPSGGLKAIPENASRLLLLNQADREAAIKSGHEVARLTRNSFSSVLIGNLKQTPDLFAIHKPIAGIILAAGSSSRFSGTKQLAAWRGQTLLQSVIQIAQASLLFPIVVIIGANQEAIRDSLADYNSQTNSQITIVTNPDWEEGQSSSIRVGIDQLPKTTDGAVFLLADQPLIPSPLVDRLQDVRAESRSWIVAPRYKGKRANPVLFGQELFGKLMTIQGDQGGRSLIQEPNPYPVSWVDWDEPGWNFDVDTQEDYKNLIEGGSI